MEIINKQIFDKYTIETQTFSTGKYAVRILNNNAKPWNATVCYYSFSTLEKALAYIETFKDKVNKRKEQMLEWKKERMERRKKEGSITQIVKKALASKYGFPNVKVNRGKGTASGWVEASVFVDKVECNDHDNVFSCTCSDVYRKIRTEAQEIAHTAVDQAGMRFGTYYSDDGYNSSHSEFLLDIRQK